MRKVDISVGRIMLQKFEFLDSYDSFELNLSVFDQKTDEERIKCLRDVLVDYGLI